MEGKGEGGELRQRGRRQRRRTKKVMVEEEEEEEREKQHMRKKRRKKKRKKQRETKGERKRINPHSKSSLPNHNGWDEAESNLKHYPH